MKKIIRLNETDLSRLIKKVINEQPVSPIGVKKPQPVQQQTTKFTSCNGGEQGKLNVISGGNTLLWVLDSTDGKRCVVSPNDAIKQAYLTQQQGPTPTGYKAPTQQSTSPQVQQQGPTPTGYKPKA